MHLSVAGLLTAPALAGTLMAATAAIPPQALTLHREATIVDLHADTILDVAAGRRDIAVRSPVGYVDLPRLRDGGVDVQVFALFVHPNEAAQGFVRVSALLSAFDRLVAANEERIGLATTAADIERLQRSGRLAAVLAVENASALQGQVSNVDVLYRRGVRMMSLTWNNSNDLADGAGESAHDGLTPLGQQVVARMQALGMVVDVSHLSAQSFWDVVEASRGPLVATHSNAAGLTPHARNLADDQLRAIARRGGLVGVNFYPPFTGGAAIAQVLDHIGYMVRIMGPDHVALGSDFDGFTQRVNGLEDVSKLPGLTAGLLARGYEPHTIRRILGGNAVRVFQGVWGR